MPLLSCHRVAKHFGERMLFSDVSFDIEENSRVGFVGVNGCGKSTLFHMLIGGLEADEGQIVRSKDVRIGFMQQHMSVDPQVTLFDEVLSVFSELVALETELHSLQQMLSDTRYSGDQQLIERQAELTEQFTLGGGLYYRGRVRSALLGLGFSQDDLSRTMDTFSGGQRSKAAMARLLLSDSNLLLLDEPTNHLDIESVEWLETYLNEYHGAMIVISHDRYFLDRITDRTMELSGGKLYITNGNYSAHKEKREQDKDIEKKHYIHAKREIQRIEDNIQLLKQWNREKSIRAAESREKRVERLKAELVIPEAELASIRFTFEAKSVSGNEVIEAAELSKSFGDTVLFTDAELHLRRADRCFLYGPNGCGKSTLLKIVNGQLRPDRGFIKLGTNVSIGYYDQTQSGLHDEKMAIDELWDEYPAMTQTQIRSAMAAFLFRGDDVFKQVGLLSGGERARLLLLKLMLAGNNLLLLDEPTNHLDIPSREALEEALMDYEGTMLIVSHDRYFINRMAKKMIRLLPCGTQVIEGGYDALCERVKREQQTQRSVAVNGDAKNPSQAPPNVKKDGALRRKLGARVRVLEQNIAQIEDEADRMRCELELPDTAADYELVMQLSSTIDELDEQLLVMMEEWESLQQQMEDMA